MRNKLILDTDGGVDDAQALQMLIAADRAPDAITTVFGNVDLAQASRNILDVLAASGAASIPVHLGAAGPLIGTGISAREIHGNDGLGGAPRPARALEAAGQDAVGFLIAELRAAAAEGRKVDLLMIGPLTNLALALRLAPDCAQGIGQLTIMGGTLNGRGNVTPAAEFNILADPEAAQIVLTAPLETLLVPWESCTEHRLPAEEIEALLAAAPENPFGEALLRHAMRVIKGFTGKDYFRFVDPLAAAAVIEPGLVRETLEASLEVVLAAGPARGMVLVDPSGRLGTPKVKLLVRADTARLSALLGASLHLGA